MYILDRFEENFAIIEKSNEDGSFSIIKVDKQFITPDVSEGDVLLFENSLYFTDIESTKQRKEKIRKRIRRIKKKTQSEN